MYAEPSPEAEIAGLHPMFVHPADHLYARARHSPRMPPAAPLRSPITCHGTSDRSPRVWCLRCGAGLSGDIAGRPVRRCPALLLRPRLPETFCTLPIVLDSTSGKPAPEMRIRLDRLNTTGFVLQAQG